ncbi:hypothetical protein J7K93_01475, partial [bacterium]|nr:hypothetical protein [bacterium]
LRMIVAFMVLREKVMLPLLSNACKRKSGPKPKNRVPIDYHYENIKTEMQSIFKHIGIAA